MREYTIFRRRRVYKHDKYGYPTSEWYWSEWDWLCFVEAGRVAAALKYWRDLNDYAVSCRGPGAMQEFTARQGLPFVRDTNAQV